MKLVLLIASLTIIMGEIVGVLEVSRHGARSPDDLLPFAKDYFKSPGKLTAVGMR